MADRMLGVAIRTFADADDSTGEYSVLYQHATGGEPYSMAATFDAEHLAVEPGTNIPISTINPVMGVRLSAMLHPPKKGDTVIIRGVVYDVITHRPDGIAGAVLELHKKT